MKKALTVFAIIVCFVIMMFASVLQTSYRYNPPTVEEYNAHPIIIKFLWGEVK